ncbi:C40 family peptidase [Sphaerothrix gracilis]|uniref:C40 family peptidase n=1 Tax=Sphaerothrix gracilis TaxID=3151835 RepID=UPI0031FD7119
MIVPADIRAAIAHPLQEYVCQSPLNLYKAPTSNSLVTQAASGRHLRLLGTEADAIAVRLVEDDYPGWVRLSDWAALQPAAQPYRAPVLSTSAIQARLPQIIVFTEAAMQQPNEYLWGGTVGPNYDCSGLMQTAFAAAGIWLPRDAYQQAAFTQPVSPPERQPGDLIFFGTSERITHVALYLGGDRYVHSSGKDQGRNGIGIDSISDPRDPVSCLYQAQLLSFGRVVASYQPTGKDYASRSDLTAPISPLP